MNLRGRLLVNLVLEEEALVDLVDLGQVFHQDQRRDNQVAPLILVVAPLEPQLQEEQTLEDLLQEDQEDQQPEATLKCLGLRHP